MATNTVNIDGDDEGWPTVTLTDIDEPIASADGAVCSTTIKDDVIIFDIETPPDIGDSDTVTDVEIIVRAKEASGSAGNNNIDVNLLIGGVEQGASPTGTANLTTSFQDLTVEDTEWNADWTAAQLAGMQVQCGAGQAGKASSATWEIDCVDVVVTYTPGGPPMAALMASYRRRREF